MKMRALNEPDPSESSSDQSSNNVNNNNDRKQPAKISKESLAADCFDKYHQALVAIQESKNKEALGLLKGLNNDLEELDDPENSNSLDQLRFSVLKNLGNLVDEDIDYYAQALDMDGSDINLWIKTGHRATRLKHLNLARSCYEQALLINPNNWVAIDRLIELYYILHLPFELCDICSRALSINSQHEKALVLLNEAKRMQPYYADPSSGPMCLESAKSDHIIGSLDRYKKRRRELIQEDLTKSKKTRLSITLDSARTQSLTSFGNYIVKIYERFAKQGITSNSVIDISLSNIVSFSQQANNTSSINSQSNNQNSCEAGNSRSQDIDMAIEGGDGVSASDSNEKSDNRNEQTVSTDDQGQTKSNSRTTRFSNNQQQSGTKNSSFSFAAMLFPMNLGDKRRSSRNKSNQDDTFSFKAKFDELNEFLPESLRIGAIEQALQQRKSDETEKVQQEESSSLTETTLEAVREDIIVKDIIEAISMVPKKYHQNGGETNEKTLDNNRDLKLCDLFYVYLSKVSAKKQNTLPETFIKIYKFYRKLKPLPKDVFVEIGTNELTLDELWFTLTANEVLYQSQECKFLLRILEQLEIHFDAVQHREFLVRLFLVLGTHLEYGYLESALENIEEETKVYASNRKIITRAYIKTLIDKKNELMQSYNDNSENYLESINRLAPKSENEMSDREIQTLCSAIKSAQCWQRGINILNQRNDLSPDIIVETINICLKNDAKMDAILASKLCKEAISNPRPITWTCLYRGWENLLSPEELMDEDTVENMDKFFELGHQTLGKKLCCTTDDGEFLMLYVKHLLDDRDNYEERELLGALSCLFGYPSKKPAAVVGHKAQPVKMTLDYAKIIYEYLAPDDMPTYMSPLRKVGIASEVEPLMKEIIGVIPPECRPADRLAQIEDFIDRGAEMALELVEVPFQGIYYYLADYYFKNKDFTKAKEMYHLDLVANPNRFDSWAASGLIRSNGIDKGLSEGTVTVKSFLDGSFRDLANATIRCFDKATKIKPNEPNATLWVEFGTVTYNLASLASRLAIYTNFEARLRDQKVEKDETLESRHEYLFGISKDCFLSANTLCESEEKWLHYYMLGKIAEKSDLYQALDYYFQADAQLFLEGAKYPRKISYYNPPELASEAMEVHYRLHNCILKFLLTCNSITQDQMNKLKSYLLRAQQSPFVSHEAVTDVNAHRLRNIDSDVSILLEHLTDIITQNTEFDELIFMCLHGLKRCLSRCGKNFKALFRLAYYYKRINDHKWASRVLLQSELETDSRIRILSSRKPHLAEFRSAPPDLKGFDSLFKDRKSGNLYFNIWRVPVEEVDRPGSFEHWMFKCTSLLIEACESMKDINMLISIALQLSKQPGMSKRYLQDKPRFLLILAATKSVVNIVTKFVDVPSNNLETRARFLKLGVEIADKFIKANVYPEMMRDLMVRLQSKTIAPIPSEPETICID